MAGLPAFDAPAAEAECTSFIRTCVEAAGATGVVVGLSGGVDSAVVAALCVRALGAARVHALLLPLDFTPAQDSADALALANELGMSHETVPIGPAVEVLARASGADPSAGALPIANLRARVRMVLLYLRANERNALVAGTGDRSEDAIGFFTKYGDGAADLLPIAHVWKTDVRLLARHLGVPEAIAGKPSSPHLWPGHRAEDEIPLPYERMDPVLHGLLDRRLSPETAAREAGVPEASALEIASRIQRSRHKREMPPTVRPIV